MPGAHARDFGKLALQSLHGLGLLWTGLAARLGHLPPQLRETLGRGFLHKKSHPEGGQAQQTPEREHQAFGRKHPDPSSAQSAPTQMEKAQTREHVQGCGRGEPDRHLAPKQPAHDRAAGGTRLQQGGNEEKARQDGAPGPKNTAEDMDKNETKAHGKPPHLDAQSEPPFDKARILER